jgi:hypothetical protein
MIIRVETGTFFLPFTLLTFFASFDQINSDKINPVQNYFS